MNQNQAVKAAKKSVPATLLEIVYFTDPLCCWSWAFEPQWRRLRYEYDGLISWRYRMGGLIADWNNFQDPLNSVSRPLQMGPVWMEARHVSGMPIRDTIWIENPPDSSLPACLGVKCAERQSAAAAEAYLRRLREAIMLEGRNIAREEELLALAQAVAAETSGLLDPERFAQDWQNKVANEALREDLTLAAYHSIGRFPTLTLKGSSGPGIMITGYRPYEVLLAAVSRVAPELPPARKPADADDYLRYWDGATERELAEVMG